MGGWSNEDGRGRWGLRCLPLFLLLACIALLSPAGAHAAPPYPEAVLLVSGFETETPFTSPDPSCDGKEGSEWNPPGGIAETLNAAGFEVFTAPVTKTGKAAPTPCTGAGEPLPGAGLVIDSNGQTDSNGAALAGLIGFLRDNYGVTDLHVVGHSDGGLWSRAGITQNSSYAGVTIQSLTTLGTPHTGSYLADLAIELAGGKCNFSNKTEQRICEALDVIANLVLIELGPDATRELTNDFLATWNPKQTIGNCPVSVIAGDHVNFGIPFFEYYTPSDGLVGLASAQARLALDIDGHLIPAPEIPDLREAGVYDVVHGASVSFLSKKTLLNQAQISQNVADNTLISGAEPCNVAAVPDIGLPAQRLRAPLYRLVPADKRGRLPRPGAEDFAVSGRGVKVRCGFNDLEPLRLLGDGRLRVHAPGRCRDGLRARKRGAGRAKALLMRAHPRRHVLARIDGQDARIRARGKAPRKLKAQVRDDAGWKRLKLDRGGRTTLPDTDSASLELRVRAKGRRGIPADTAHLTISR